MVDRYNSTKSGLNLNSKKMMNFTDERADGRTTDARVATAVRQ